MPQTIQNILAALLARLAHRSGSLAATFLWAAIIERGRRQNKNPRTLFSPPNFDQTLQMDRRPDGEDGSRAKRQKTAAADMDPKANPYLAHMYQDEAPASNAYGNGYPSSSRQKTSALAKFKRHASTSPQAKAAEDGPNNPFTGQPLSQQYFNILRTRRNLPVHAQRSVEASP